MDLAVVRLGGKLQGLASERLDHVLAQVGDPERAAARHLELAHERVVDLALVDGPEKGARLGWGGQAKVEVVGVGFVVDGPEATFVAAAARVRAATCVRDPPVLAAVTLRITLC